MSEVLYCELIRESARHWSRLDPKQKNKLLDEWSHRISNFDGSKIFFIEGAFDLENSTVVKAFEKSLIKIISDSVQHEAIRGVKVEYHQKMASFSNFIVNYRDFDRKFRDLDFGGDVAERDTHLLDYFLETTAYDRVKSGARSIIIGPKGSGKSSILKVLASDRLKDRSQANVITITPEIFATNMVKRFITGDDKEGQESRSIIATWEFSILIEVFKRIKLNPKSTTKYAMQEINRFLSKYSEFADESIFHRFISAIKMIKSFKFNYDGAAVEATVKENVVDSIGSKELHPLESTYNVILKIRDHVKSDFVVLVDELDQGWDNTNQANAFIAGLIDAAIRIKYIGLKINIIVFVRAEIFDLARVKLPQLDKIRSSIENLKWNEAELEKLLYKRICYNFGSDFQKYEPKDVLDYFFENVEKTPGLLRGTGYRFLISRTTRRPREVLQLARLAHQLSVESGETFIREEALTKAVEEFSKWKLEHLASEYMYIYPNIELLLTNFRGAQYILGKHELITKIENYLSQVDRDKIIANGNLTEIINILYQIEFLGVEKMNSTTSDYWMIYGYNFMYDYPSANPNISNNYMIHPAFWRALEMIGG